MKGEFCMRNFFYVLLFLFFVTTTIFGEEFEVYDVKTSDGLYSIIYHYDGQNRGQTRANWMIADPNIGGGERPWTPDKAHLECLNYIIGMLKPKKGDTYVITIRRPTYSWNTLLYGVRYTFVIEFTSSTQYIYWFSGR